MKNTSNSDSSSNLQAIRDAISQCLAKDQHKFIVRLNKISANRGNANSQQKRLQTLQRDIEQSVAATRRKQEKLPVPVFSPELPINNSRGEIEALIKQNQVVVIAGETGSGKTTQLPKMCVAIGRGVKGLIGHTQPRRIAARSVAGRIAEELNSPLGDIVGYKVRFTDNIKPTAYIKLMTDGILLAEMQSDRFLNQYDTIIIDEAHERNLNIDFLLGYLKQLLPKRPDLKLIITSATIDTERFSKHFHNAPIIEVSGRTYPVEVRYRPVDAAEASLEAEEAKSPEKRDVQQAIADAINELDINRNAGDTLVFLSGEREIRETEHYLQKHLDTRFMEILTLYSRLSAKDQNRIFSTSQKRRIILSTNVAETSLTVPGIKYVIDSGTARINHYSYRSKVERLPVEKISQSSANQRKGRCGRVSNGVCIRLYSEEDFINRPLYTVPEIQRVNLASVILRMKSLKLAHISDFPFIDPPDNRYVKDGFKLLNELGAIDHDHKLTATGRELSRLPIDPKLGRMLLAAVKKHCVQEMLIITSALSIQDPRERPHGAQTAADQKHALFFYEPQEEDEATSHKAKQATKTRSDFIVFIHLWNTFHKQSQTLSNNQLKKWCQSHYLSYMRMREWVDVYLQLKSMITDTGVKLNQTPAGYDEIHQALLMGLLGNIGFKVEKQEFEGARHIRFNVFPGSIVHKSPPKWLMAVNLLETSRLYALVCAQIQPQWIETAAQHLLKRHYTEAHWEKKAAQVAALESVTLYGLTIAAKRKINYGPIAPKESREIFIRAALVQQDVNCNAAFFKHNCELIKNIKNDEEKERRRDILVTDEEIYAFYDSKIPQGIYNVPLLLKWLKGLPEHEAQSLYLSKEYLVNKSAHTDKEVLYPKQLRIDKLVLPLRYRFEPGHAEDGVTVDIPEFLLAQIPAYKFEWLVPGLLEEKITALIKSLPKQLRRSFVPAPNFTKACLEALTPYESPLLESVSTHLHKITGVAVPEDAWNLAQLPGHLIMNINVVDGNDKSIRAGKDLEALKAGKPQTLMPSQTARRTTAANDIEKEGMTTWDIDKIPTSLELQQQGHTLSVYPALVDNTDSVAIKLFDQKPDADRSHQEGLYRLFTLEAQKQLKYCAKNIPHLNSLCTAFSPLDSCEQFKAEVLRAVVFRVFFYNADDIRDKSCYEAHKHYALKNLMTQLNTLCALLAEILDKYQRVLQRLNQTTPMAWLEAIADIRSQLEQLIHRSFITQTDERWLARIPVYLEAIDTRFTKLEQSPQKDRQRQQQIAGHWLRYLQLKEQQRNKIKNPEAFTQYRWMIEEMRVSSFSQGLKTALPVSNERLQKQLALALKRP